MAAPHDWTLDSHDTKDQVKEEDSADHQFLMSILLEDEEKEQLDAPQPHLPYFPEGPCE